MSEPYFEIDDDEEPGFFGLLNDVWAAADERREGFKSEHGELLGNWLADIRQYQAAWTGDAWQDEARRVENFGAFSTIDDYDFWDQVGGHLGFAIVECNNQREPDEILEDGAKRWYFPSRPGEYRLAGGKVFG